MSLTSSLPHERVLIQFARLGLYLLILVLAVLNQLIQPNFIYWDLLRSFYLFVMLGLFLHGLPLFFIDYYFKKSRWIAISIGLDIFLIASLEIKTELNQSLFLFMYLLTIVLSGLIFRRSGAFLAAVGCSLGFSVVSFLGPEIKSMNFLFLFILTNAAFFAVAWLSGRLSEQIDFLGAKLKAESLTLRTVQKLNQSIVETIPSGLITTNAAGEILTANGGAEKILQRSPLIGKRIAEVVPVLSQLRPGDVKECEITAGSEQFLAKISCLLQEGEGFSEALVLWVFEDLTQIRRLEFAVRQSEKMAAIGQLASGIAHEIRNPLAGISGSIELLSEQNRTEDDRKLTKIILREIDRLNNLITEFLDFAKPEKIPHDPVDLNRVLEEVLQFAQPHAPPSLNLKTDFAELHGMTGSQDKLKQAFINIIINAYQAMTQLPSVTVSPSLLVQTAQRDNKITVRIKDSGSGMPDDVKKRIFEPFMTTKPKGTGLGLAISHKILQSHRGQIFVESTVGLGTEFVIVFSTSNA